MTAGADQTTKFASAHAASVLAATCRHLARSIQRNFRLIRPATVVIRNRSTENGLVSLRLDAHGHIAPAFDGVEVPLRPGAGSS